jgi:hypothetical protein
MSLTMHRKPSLVSRFLLTIVGQALLGCGSEPAGRSQPATPAVPGDGARAQADSPAPPGTYGPTGGEEVAAAELSVPGTLPRSRSGDTFYLIQNAHLGQGRFGQPTVFVDYEVQSAGEHNGISVVLHGDDGSTTQVLILGPMQQHGTLPIEIPFSGPGQSPFPKNLEIYFTRNDPRYGPNAPTFKVSNSTVIGTMTKLTRARNWTREELGRFTQPPPNYANANAHPNVGRDTEIAGDGSGGMPQRYVEPGGRLLGVEFRTGEWEGEKCLGGLVPVFHDDQPVTISGRVMARHGYAVGAVEVQSARFVDAIRLVFERVKDDGTLEPADSYESDWIGYPSDLKTKRLASEGRPVIGIKCQQGAILNGLALVIGP